MERSILTGECIKRGGGARQNWQEQFSVTGYQRIPFPFCYYNTFPYRTGDGMALPPLGDVFEPPPRSKSGFYCVTLPPPPSICIIGRPSAANVVRLRHYYEHERWLSPSFPCICICMCYCAGIGVVGASFVDLLVGEGVVKSIAQHYFRLPCRCFPRTDSWGKERSHM